MPDVFTAANGFELPTIGFGTFKLNGSDGSETIARAIDTGYTLVDSYHCSRYNQNTGRLTADMFREAVQAALRERLNA